MPGQTDNPSVPETTVAPTTKSAETVPEGYTEATVNQWTPSGKWGCYFGNWSGTASGAYKWVSDADYNIYVDKANKGSAWLVQGSYTDNVTNGHTYKVTVDVTASKACSIGIKEDLSNEKDLQVYTDIPANGTRTLTGTYTVTNNQIKVMFELGQNVDAGTNINFKNIKIEDTTASTTKESTTPTTVAPTTKGTAVVTTTVAPTTAVEDDTIPAPIGLTYAGNETLPYYFAWQAPTSDIESYNVYVDGRLAGTSNVPNINLSIDAFKDGKKDYTISVKSVRGGRESEATSVTYSFRDEVPTTVVPTTVAPTTAAPTTVAQTPDASTPDGTTTDTSTTAKPKATTKKVTKKVTKKASLKKTKITKKITKKLSSKKVKLTFKKVMGAKKYTVQVSKSKKFKKVLYKKTVKKKKVTLSSKKLKNKKKLYVRVKAVGAKKWSKVVKIKVKK